MIATVQAKSPPSPPCIVYWTGKVGIMSVVTRTYCNLEVSSGDGVSQLPDKVPLCKICQEAVAKTEALISVPTSST